MAEQDDLWAVVVHEDGSKSIVMNDGDLATIATNLQADRDRWRDEAHRLMAEAGHMAYCRKYAAADPEAVSD